MAQESSSDAINKSNNPLNPAVVVSFQDYYIPSIEGAPGQQANVGILRALTPFELGGQVHLMRTTLPIVGVPAADGGIDSGAGDLVVFDIIMHQQEHFAWGVGPLLVAPTAESRRYGAQRWQLGAAGGFAAPRDWGVFGALVTYQQSVGDSNTRPDVSTLTVQPFGFYNLPNAFYLQSAGSWSFDLEHDTHYMPIGLGLGRHWEVSRLVSFNTFIEPQYVVSNDGAGTPDWQIFVGLNFNYSLADVIARRREAH
jgi:hypothetical protein